MLYIMRHGRTDWNNLRKIQGHTDIPLNAEGRAMAEKAREECQNVPLDVCYCSPLLRARETAEIVLRGRDIPIIPDERLQEMSFGDFEGTPFCFSGTGSAVGVIFQTPEKYTASVGGAETFDHLFARTGEFLRDVALPLTAEGKDVLIVGHWAMNLSIVSQLRQLPRADFWQPKMENCKLIRLI